MLRTFKRLFSRATMTLALMVLTTASAWAETAYVEFQTLVGNEWKTRHVTATVLTGNEETLPWGYYVVNSDIHFDHGVQFSGNVYIILADGCTMTMGSTQNRIGNFGLYGSAGTASDNYGSDYELYIYGQSQQSGRLEIYSSTTKSNVSCIKVKELFVFGGNILLNGYNGINTSSAGQGTFIYNGNVSFSSLKEYGKGIDCDRFYMSGGSLTFNGLAQKAIYSKYFTMSGGSITVDDAGEIISKDWASGTFSMTGGSLSVNGLGKEINASTITLGLTKDGDQIKAGNYAGTVTVETGKKLMDYNDHAALYYGTLTDEQKTAIKGKTLVPAKFDGTGDKDDPYVIHTAKGWDAFCAMFGTSAAPYDFNDVYVKLGNDISVTTMAGISGHPFKGHFDGDGHTLTVNYSVDNENYIAPFRFVDGATFEDLNIEGTIYASAMKAGGLIGDGAFTKTTITNCRVSATITGGNETGGFISSGKVEIDHCVFNGKFINSYFHGGFIGHNNSDGSSISNSLFDPQSESNYRNTFYSAGNNPTIYNCYYTTNAVADGQAKLAHRITADPGADMTLKENSPNGVQFGTTCYAANEETVYLTLKDPGTPPDGYTQIGGNYMAGSQTLPFNGTYYTLEMGNEDVRITAFTLATYNITYNLNDGSWGGIEPPASYNIQSDDVMLPAPTKDGNSFMGWYDNVGLTGDPVSRIPAGSTGDKAFYAKWQATRTKKSLTACTAEVPNPIYQGEDVPVTIYYENNPLQVYDGETLLTVYHYDAQTDAFVGDYLLSMETLEPTGTYGEYDVACSHLGEHCRVILTGEGDYEGTLTADVVITLEPAEGDWGNLHWEYKDCVLTISGSGTMPTESDYDQYPWFDKRSGIKTIIIENGVTSVAAKAFGSPSNTHYYDNVETITLPTEGLTSIGENAFIYCGGTIDLDNVLKQVNINNIGDNAFYLVGKLTSTLSDAADNTNKIGLLSSAQRADITINRTLYKDNKWNTLCLPFNLEDGDYRAHPEYEATPENYSNGKGGKDGKALTGTLLEVCTLMELDIADAYDHITGFENSTLYLNFKPATSIEAGKPYIIKWASGDDITSLTFNGVKIDATAPTEVTSNDGKVSFKGTYAPIVWDNTNTSILFLGVKDNKSALYYPQPDLTDPQNPKYPRVNAFRAYFQLNNGQHASAFNLNFDDNDATGIVEMRNEFATPHSDQSENGEMRNAGWFTLSGTRLSAQPTKPGLYINNGRKVVIK